MDDAVLGELLRDAVVKGDDASFEELAKSGPDAVGCFHGWLSGTRKIELPRGRDREFIDNTSTVSCRLATRFPDEYARLFASRQWTQNGFVLAGLGYTKRGEALPVLIQALVSDAPGVTRLVAARSLRYFPHPDAVAALTRAIDDSDYLVRYHATESLGIVGDRAALDRILSLVRSSNRGIAIVAHGAARSLSARLGIDIDLPGDGPWSRLRSRLAPPEEDSTE